MSTALAAARAKTKGKRRLREALEGYGADEFTLAEWTARKTQAERSGAWRWKPGDASATLAAVKAREGHQRLTDGDARFVDVETAMRAELHAATATAIAADGAQADAAPTECTWRERIGGRQFRCRNALPTKRQATTTLCAWHARECRGPEHPLERSRAIDVPNDLGLCLACYAQSGSGSRVPPRVPSAKVPGVHAVELKRDVTLALQRKRAAKSSRDADGAALSAASRCAWHKEHAERAFVWRCENRVLMHPTLRGAFLPFCGYHAPRCIQTYGGRAACAAIERRNPFGLCRPHLAAQLSAMAFAARAACRLVDSEFDVPGLVECRRDAASRALRRHPLAPKGPPPASACLEPPPLDASPAMAPAIAAWDAPPLAPMQRVRQVLTSLEALARRLQAAVLAVPSAVLAPLLSAALRHENPVSAAVRELSWRWRFLRRAPTVATRIQRIFRGNRARRRVRAMRLEHAALERLRASRSLQRIARGFVARVRTRRHREAVATAVVQLQRVLRGALARKWARETRAARRIQRQFRAYRQRCLANALRDEMAFMRALQREAARNWEELQLRLAAFRRLRARRVLRRHVQRWRLRREERARLAAERLQRLVGAVKLQRAWRRHRRYRLLQRRYASARRIQARVRGWLTRHMWRGDPGVRRVTTFVSARSGLRYSRDVVLPLATASYAVPTRRVRREAAARAIQRAARGLAGRLEANARWAAMLRRWEWLGVEPSATQDSMALGRARYGLLLPAHRYDRDPRRHMLPVCRDIKPDRGFAYQFQSLLELIEDRDGRRGWSLAREQRWRREQQRRERRDAEYAQRLQRKMEGPESAPGERAPSAAAANFSSADARVSVARALFPVGSVVHVASLQRRVGRGRRYYRAKVTAAQDAGGTTLFDVEYLERVVSERGVRLYQESRVPYARLRHIPALEAADREAQRRRRPRAAAVGPLIQSAIAQLEAEILASKRQRLGLDRREEDPAQTRDDSAPAEHRPLASVEALAARLRDTRPEFDLLRDPRDFVDFVFRNAALLRVTWLQVVDRVRLGPEGSSQPAPPPASPSIVALRRAFGFDVVPSSAHARMSERASDIESRLAALGFRYDPSANVRPDDDDKHADADADARRPETTTGHDLALAELPPASGPSALQSRDDSALPELSQRLASSASDLHRLVYELKTLPRERQRETILEVATRHARSFVCGFPACGLVFSSHEAARLHQEGVHLGQRRLATATPLVDQFMHAFWPPQSPWGGRGDSGEAPHDQHIVGHFRCSRRGCERVSFRTRRELERHKRQVHAVSPDAESPPKEPAPSSAGATATTAATPSPIVAPSRLRELLGVTAELATAKPCREHPTPAKAQPRWCRSCFLATRHVAPPCRLYQAVALPGHAATSGSAEGYVIFSCQDDAFCPVARAWDVVPLTSDGGDWWGRPRLQPRTEVKEGASPRKPSATTAASVNQEPVDEEDELVLLRVLALCRDASHVDWAIGHAVLERRSTLWTRRSRGPRDDASERHDEVDAKEVVVDASRVVAVRLKDVWAAGIVHRCARHVFRRKHDAPDDQELLQRVRRKAQDQRSGRVLARTPAHGAAAVSKADPRAITATFHRFCRPRDSAPE
ncbi:hypothetical protein ATCC90586_000199 [Pythium insidiosum]|nr:hypothetical protein ATCC90586_000199 [Pythium insidiosum]